MTAARVHLEVLDPSGNVTKTYGEHIPNLEAPGTAETVAEHVNFTIDVLVGRREIISEPFVETSGSNRQVQQITLTNSEGETWQDSVLFRLAQKLGHVAVKPTQNGAASAITLNLEEIVEAVETLMSQHERAVDVLEGRPMVSAQGRVERALVILNGAS